MAEGIARSLAPEDALIFSAGSEPTKVRPQAIQALDEIGLDIRDQYSKAVADLPFADMDLVITLCADEVCPILPATTRYLHWPLADPAGAGDTPEDELNAFRSARDELKKRLEALFDKGN